MPQAVAAAGAFFSGIGAGLGGATVLSGATGALAAGAAIGGSAFGSAFVSIGLLAASTALQYVLTPKAPKITGALDDRYKQAVKSPVAPLRLLMGTVQAAGVIFFERWDPPYYWAGYLLANHECDALESLWINNQRVYLDPDGTATTPPFDDGTTRFIEVSFRAGTDDQAIDPIIARDFPDMPPGFRQRGQCAVVIKAHYGTNETHGEIWGSASFLPNVQFRLRGAKCYDPRDGNQVIGDTSTWRWTDNAALCTARYWMHRFGRKQLVETSRIDWVGVAKAADVCDQGVPLSAGGGERRYTVNGLIESNQQPAGVLQNLLASMAGHPVVGPSGMYVVAAEARQAALTIAIQDIVGGLQFQIKRPTFERINTVRATYVEPGLNYQAHTTPIWQDAAALAKDGQTLEHNLSLPFVEGAERAQRLAKLAIQQNRAGRILTCKVTVEWYRKSLRLAQRRGCPSLVGLTVLVSLEGLHELDGLFRVTRKGWADDGASVQVTLEEDAASIYEWLASDAQSIELDQEVIDA